MIIDYFIHIFNIDHQTYSIALTWHQSVEVMTKNTMWNFIVDVVHGFGSSLRSNVSQGFLRVSKVFLFIAGAKFIFKMTKNNPYPLMPIYIFWQTLAMLQKQLNGFDFAPLDMNTVTKINN